MPNSFEDQEHGMSQSIKAVPNSHIDLKSNLKNAQSLDAHHDNTAK